MVADVVATGRIRRLSGALDVDGCTVVVLIVGRPDRL
jgi:hypothetical protein